MDKADVKVHENQSDTSSVITMKEYASSEYPSSEPPPAYMKPRSNALRIAKLAAFTVIVSSIILGGFMFAASWIQARATRNLDLTLNQELLEDLLPNYEPLVGNEVLPEQQVNSLNQNEPKNTVDDKTAEIKDKVIVDKNEEGLVPPPPPEEKQEDKKTLDLDEIANMLMRKNIRGNVNCIVEKRRNEELVDHAPMSLNIPSANLPFGLNITTPPRLQHMTGEQMIVICRGDEDEDKDEIDDEEKSEQMQPIAFPLPQHLVHQFQQVPQVIPIARLIQQIPMQQPVFQPVPVQQQVVHQQPQFQPQHQIQFQPQRLIAHPPVEFELQQVHLPQVQQVQHPQQIQPQQMIFQQPPQFSQHQPQMMHKPEVRFQPQIIPIREVRLNEERIPLNHIMHNRVPVNPLAFNDLPVSQMPITHMPMKTEVQAEEEPVPVHHLVPPRPQEVQLQNFNQEEPGFNRPVFHDRPNRFPLVQPPAPSRVNPEIREPRMMRIQNPMAQKMRFPVFPPPDVQVNNIQDIRELPPFESFSRPVEGRVAPIPSPEMKAPLPFHRVHSGPNPMPQEPKVIRMFPLFDEPRRQGPHNISPNTIRFSDSSDSEEVEENRLPIITEITKIIPIRIEREENKISPMPLIPFNPKPEIKTDVDNKLEKLPERPFPIPINAILDMIFRGIRPLMGSRPHNVPIPIDIKIERIENKPLDILPIIKKFEILEKLPQEMNQEIEENQESNENSPESTPVALNNMKTDAKMQRDDEPDKDVVEAKVERVEIFDKEEDNAHPIPIPSDARDPQIFKIDGSDAQHEAKEPAAFENRAFLPNGQGRGARVFPIPQQMREAEIFSVSDARSNKNLDIEVGSSYVVGNDKMKALEGRQARIMSFPHEGEINLFPVPESRAMEGLAAHSNPQPQTQTFTVNDAKSVQLYPVEMSHEEADAKLMPQGDAPNEETRPHYVQPRSV